MAMKFCIHGHQESTCVRCNPEHRIAFPLTKEEFRLHFEEAPKILADYYRDLMAGGVPEKLASELTMELQRTMIGAGW